MIQPNEIRIRNIVNQLPVTETAQSGMESIVREGGEIVIDTHNIYFVLSNPESVEGVPLTEEWLLNTQFEKDKYAKSRFTFHKGQPYSKGEMFISVDFDQNYLQLSVGKGGDSCDYVFLPLPEFVHTFQNQFHALTGEELTVKTEVNG